MVIYMRPISNYKEKAMELKETPYFIQEVNEYNYSALNVLDQLGLDAPSQNQIDVIEALLLAVMCRSLSHSKPMGSLLSDVSNHLLKNRA